MSKDNLIHGRTCVYNVNYYIVWSVKYRRKVLTAEVETYLKSVLQDVAQEKGFEIYLETIGSISEEAIKAYIERQAKGGDTE